MQLDNLCCFDARAILKYAALMHEQPACYGFHGSGLTAKDSKGERLDEHNHQQLSWVYMSHALVGVHESRTGELPGRAEIQSRAA